MYLLNSLIIKTTALLDNREETTRHNDMFDAYYNAFLYNNQGNESMEPPIPLKRNNK